VKGDDYFKKLKKLNDYFKIVNKHAKFHMIFFGGACLGPASSDRGYLFTIVYNGCSIIVMVVVGCGSLFLA